MAVFLPETLQRAADQMLEGFSRKQLAARAGKISDHYRAGGASSPVVQSDDDVVAYLFSRLPGTFGATAAVFDQVAQALPAFNPGSMLDVGCGPGTASWAGAQAWPGMTRFTMLDHNRHFLNIARDLVQNTRHAHLKQADQLEADLSAASHNWPKSDLVVAGFALAELADDNRQRVVESMWQACTGVMVVIEPGTTPGYQRTLAVRDWLIGAGAHVLAPCPHAGPCPIVSPDWCHFVQRVPRTRDHMIAKAGTVPFEDEKFSYIAVSRTAPAPRAPFLRVLLHPNSSKPGMTFKACTPDGVRQVDVPKRNKPLYAIARRMDWGDAMPLSAPEKNGQDTSPDDTNT